jgi:hypothetical protein
LKENPQVVEISVILLPFSDAGASGVLTIHQVNDIARMLERHQVATLGTNGTSSNGVSEMLAYIQATQARWLFIFICTVFSGVIV